MPPRRRGLRAGERVVDVVGPEGVLARGICRYAAAELREVLEAQAEGAPAPDHVAPVIHRDDLVLEA